MENPFNFLKKKYNNLHTAPEVQKAAERTEFRTGEKVSENPEERIGNYLNRFKEILDRPDPEKRAMGIEALKRVLHKQLIIKDEHIPLEYFLEQERTIAEQQGHGRPEPTDNWKESKIQEVKKGQERSLDAWIDYLSSPDAMYPDWAKYWAFRSMTQMGGYNKKEKRFTRRTEQSSQPFPTLNIACLAKTIDIIQRQVAITGLPKNDPERIKKEKDLMYTLNHDTVYRDLLSTENFAKLYLHALEKFAGMSWNHLENIAGQWKTYEHNSDPQELYDSLQGYPLEWCTAGNIETARNQLQGGDFHVYYSQNDRGLSVIPRIAIRMEGDTIAEVRGIEKDQNIDQFIQPIVDEKLDAFGDRGTAYLKKSEDMKKMTIITEKHRAGGELNTAELRFLYELDSPIEGFGYQKDPRITEIRDGRNGKLDFITLYDFKPEEVVENITEVNEYTKAVYDTHNHYSNLWNMSSHHFQELGELVTESNIRFFNRDFAEYVKFTNPTTVNWNELIKTSQEQKAVKNSFTLNQETLNLNFENMTPFIPDTSKYIGKPHGEVFAEIIKQYGKTHYIPGFEYQQWCRENPEKIPPILKEKDSNGNYVYYYTPGTVIGRSDGRVIVPSGYWLGDEWSRFNAWVEYDWLGDARVLLLPRIAS